MEKVILKTLIYADIFDSPLKINELLRWLIRRKVTLRQMEGALRRLIISGKCEMQNGYYFLPGKDRVVNGRKQKEKYSARYLQKAKIISQVLKLIPWIKLVGISGGLAMNNVAGKDDIDLFIITGKNRLWISRLMCLGLLSLMGQRRKAGDKGREIAGKLCINILLEENKLEQRSKDIFVAHEVLQMKVLWQRDGIYSKYLADNEWVFKFLPNWVCEDVVSSKYYVLREKTEKNRNSHNTKYKIHNTIIDRFENLAKKFQLKIMETPKGMERIEEGALYFHPLDCRQRVLDEFKKRVSSLSSGTP